MNRKYLISLGLIVILLLIILFTNKDNRFALPELKKWDGKASEIILTGANEKIHLTSVGEKWFVNKEKYPADPGVINTMLTRFRDITISDHISNKGYHGRYDLTNDKGIRVVIKKSGNVVRNILIGKKGATSKHTFIKLHNRPDVYQVTGIFDRLISLDINRYRNKKIFIPGEPAAIEQLSVTYKNKTFVFYKKQKEEVIDKKDKDSVKTYEWLCKGYKNKLLNKYSIDNLISSLISLRADSYPDEEEVVRDKLVCEISFKQGTKVNELKIFNKKGDKYFSTSTQNPYVFFLNEYAVKKFFIENLNNFVNNK